MERKRGEKQQKICFFSHANNFATWKFMPIWNSDGSCLRLELFKHLSCGCAPRFYFSLKLDDGAAPLVEALALSQVFLSISFLVN